MKYEMQENAPAEGLPTDRTNSRWPSYSGWANFVTDTGLSDVFAELMPDHPGVGKIKLRHLERIESVNPDKIAEYNKGRLEWLKYWVRWAILNCSNPVIVNT